MTTANTNVIARVAAAVAGFGLVAMSFAPLAQAQTMTMTTATTTTTAAATFSRDLTLGSTGTDVTALQTWLMAKGFSIPAGATGYFGAQTKAALAAYQAANAITPAAGYFGAITRAKVMAAGSSTTSTTTYPAGCTSTAGYSTTTGKRCDSTTTTTTTSSGSSSSSHSDSSDLKGGEADLRNFDLRSEESEGDEGESKVKAATAEFDVDNGDAKIERAELTLHAQNDTIEDKPWKFIDKVRVMADGKEIGSMDAGSRDDWDEEDNTGSSADFATTGNNSDKEYTMTFDSLDYVVREGKTAKITFEFDVTDNIDTADQAQQFDIAVLDDGIRATDSENVDQFVGDDGDKVDFGFNSEENGKLSIRENSDDPDSATLKVEDDKSSDEFTVFKFDIRNTDDSDTLLTDLNLEATTSATTSLSGIIRNVTLSVDGDDYDGDINDSASTTSGDGTINFDDLDVKIKGNTTLSFTVKVEFASTLGHYSSGTTVNFGVQPSDIEAEGDKTGSDVKLSDIGGGATSNIHTLALVGFDVKPSSTSADLTTPGTNASASYGTYTVKFDVTADEDSPVYIAPTAATSASTTAGATFRINGDAYTGTTTASLYSGSASMVNGVYRVDAGQTEQFTLTVSLDPSTAGQFRVELANIHYGTVSTGSGVYGSTFNVDPDNAGFETKNLVIPN